MLIGHQKQWKLLKKAAESNRLPHALLFTGPSKLGKKTLAVEFIKLLNCQHEDFSKRPCQTCRSCRDIKKKQYPDFTLIEPIGKEIQISQMRELSWKLSLRPYLAPFKTVIIDQAHCMAKNSQSCFLKTLEEPKGKVILILITEASEILLPTILSRVQEIKFYPVKISEIEEYLLKLGVSQDKVETISQLSLGKPGKAIDFISDPQKLKGFQKLIFDLTKLVNSDLAFRFQYIKELLKEDPLNLKEILDIWLRYFRNLLMSKYSTPGVEYLDTNHQREQFSSTDNYSVSELKNILKNIESTNFLISTTNINPRLALEVLMLKL